MIHADVMFPAPRPDDPKTSGSICWVLPTIILAIVAIGLIVGRKRRDVTR